MHNEPLEYLRTVDQLAEGNRSGEDMLMETATVYLGPKQCLKLLWQSFRLRELTPFQRALKVFHPSL